MLLINSYIYQMHSNSPQPNKLYTNSIIYVESNEDTPQLTYQWQRRVLEYNNALYDISSCPASSDQYICTPLDYGCEIELTVSYGNQFQQFKYGPIQFEKQLLNQHSNQGHKSKQSTFQAYYVSNDQKEPVVIKIQKGHIDIWSGSSMLVTKGKIIQNKGQPSIMQIQRKNNGYQLLYYVGKTKNKTGYIELQFRDRLERDKLIYQIMKINGIYIPPQHNTIFNTGQQVHSLEQSLNLILQHQQPIHRNTILSIGSLEKDAGQLIESEEDQTPPYELIQDIYDILYTPTASFSLPPKKDQNTSDQKNNTRSTDTLTNGHSLLADMTEPNPQTSKVKNYKTTYNKQKIPQRKTSNMIDIDQLSPNSSSIEDDDGLSINEKIAHLASINQQLSQENEKLKKQNKKLKKTDKTDDKLQQQKVQQIKTMISSMAKRIAYLEGFNYAKDQYSAVDDKNPMNGRKSPQKTYQTTHKNATKKYKLPQYKQFKKPMPTNVHPPTLQLKKGTPNHSFKQIKPQKIKYPLPHSPNNINFRTIQPHPSMGRQPEMQGWYSPKMQPFPHR